MDIQLKQKNESDVEFFLKLFAENKIVELNAYSWPKQMQDQMINMQFNAFEQFVKNEYPHAKDFLILANNKRAGRLQVNADENCLRIINISLMPAYQKNGIGSKIIKDIIADTELNNKPVYLEVDKVNPASNLYKRFGFEIFHQDAIKYSMNYLPKNFSLKLNNRKNLFS